MIPDKPDHDNHLSQTVSSFLKEFRIGHFLTLSNFRKKKGISGYQLFESIFSCVFLGKSFHRYLEQHCESLKRDTVYRFLNSEHTNWRRFLLLLVHRILSQVILPLTSDKRMNVLIIDDSLFSRSRSKEVELLARVHDHQYNRYVKGFRMLTLGWSDGNSFLPVGFSLLSSENAKNRFNSVSSNLDKRTTGYKIRLEAMRKSTDVLLELLQQAKDYRIPASHVLFDSWFSFPATIAKVKEKGFYTIAMLKASKVRYGYQGSWLKLSEIYSQVRKKPGKARILASVLVNTGQTIDGNPLAAKIVFVRDRNRSKRWLALISTDIELSDEEIVALYGRRWSIEVFFKMLKSYLKLAKEFYSRSYYAMVAHTSIVFARYIMISLEQRRCIDDRTLGGVFYQCCDELEDLKFVTVLMMLLDHLKIFLQDKLSIDESRISVLIDSFIAGLPKQLRASLAIGNCVS